MTRYRLVSVLLVLALSTRALAAVPELEDYDDSTAPRVLMVIGGVLLGLSYTLAVLTMGGHDLGGNLTEHDRLAYVPVFGPFAAAPPRPGFDMSGFLAADGTAQVIAMAFIFGALLGRHPDPKPDDAVSWSISPGSAGHAGVSLMVRGF